MTLYNPQLVATRDAVKVLKLHASSFFNNYTIKYIKNLRSRFNYSAFIQFLSLYHNLMLPITLRLLFLRFVPILYPF